MRLTPQAAAVGQLPTGSLGVPAPRAYDTIAPTYLPCAASWEAIPSCKWKCDETYDVVQWVNKFDCGIEEVYRRNPWVSGWAPCCQLAAASGWLLT